MIICAGDIAGYGEDELVEVIKLLKAHNCITVSGNHDYLPEELSDSSQAELITQYFQDLPLHICLTVEGKHIYVVHAHPPESQHGGIKLLDPNGNIFPHRLNEWKNNLKDFDYDVLIVGHTHQVFSVRIGETQIINPGSSQFNHSCMILSVPDMRVETFALGNNKVIKTWNWGLFYQQSAEQ